MTTLQLDVSRGVSRQVIGLSGWLWNVAGGIFAVFGLGGFGIIVAGLSVHVPELAGLSAFLIAVGGWIFATDPPAAGSVRLHGVLALSYVCPALSLAALEPYSTLGFGAALFCGPLAGLWMPRRSALAAHLVAAAVVLSVPVALGIGGAALAAGLAFMVPSIWGLGFAAAWVFEAAEAQGAQLQLLGLRDALTGLANRRALDDALDRALAEASGSGEPVTVVALDLNGFKRLNDTVGHDAGDEVLVAVAGALTRCTGPSDLVARQGGDEFCVLLPGSTPGEAEVVAAAIRRELSGIEADHRITSGIGIATFPVDGADASALLAVADSRLRGNKQADLTRRGRDVDASPRSQPAGPRRDRPETPPTVTRQDLITDRGLWRVLNGILVLGGAIGVGVWLLARSLTESGALAIFAVAIVLGVVNAAWGPSLRRRTVLVVAAYVLPALALARMGPAGAALIGMTAWIGPMVALGTDGRWQAARHLAAASVLFALVLALGLVQPEYVLELPMTVGGFWVLGAAAVVIFEGTEEQGRTLRTLALRDPLTGVGNRRALDESAALPAGGGVHVVVLDLNGFKALNDTLGHDAGDQLLRQVAIDLTALVGGHGRVFRQGGDEFTVVMNGLGDDVARTLAAGIRRRLGGMIVSGIPISTGVGSASAPVDGHTVRELLLRADERLLQDKYGDDADRTIRILRGS